DPMFRRFFGGDPDGEPVERETASLGSGVIIDADAGHVLTNFHVVENADEITVNLVDGREFDAEMIGSDAQSDLAVLQIAPEDLVAIEFGDSDVLEVGDYVLALGNPFGLGHTVTSGIVSAKGRAGLNPQNYEDFIQTDAAINRGNSGGALVNLQGELIGINTAILGGGPAGGNVGIGFAIPSSMALEVVSQILEFGSVSRGLLGVYGQALTAEMARRMDLDRVRGAVISRVTPDSGAERAGIEPFDVIYEADGREVRNFNDLRNIVGLKRPGAEVDLRVIRDGRERSITATLTAADGETVAAVDSGSSAPVEEGTVEMAGATLGPIPDDHPLADELEGVMVTDIERGTPAARVAAQGQLRPGDVITSINREDVTDLDEARDAVEADDAFLLMVRRGQASFFAIIE
ncbi:MAG: Do family serine endopeptidase, partial [Pseudomonadota bacterium]